MHEQIVQCLHRTTMRTAARRRDGRRLHCRRASPGRAPHCVRHFGCCLSSHCWNAYSRFIRFAHVRPVWGHHEPLLSTILAFNVIT
jgi:hypothetical protein